MTILQFLFKRITFNIKILAQSYLLFIRLPINEQDNGSNDKLKLFLDTDCSTWPKLNIKRPETYCCGYISFLQASTGSFQKFHAYETIMPWTFTAHQWRLPYTTSAQHSNLNGFALYPNQIKWLSPTLFGWFSQFLSNWNSILYFKSYFK